MPSILYGCSRYALVAATASLVAGCTLVPRDGPISAEIMEDAFSHDALSRQASKVVYDVIDVNSQIAKSVSAYSTVRFSKMFGNGQGRGFAVVGVGDVLSVTIFEASPDGLFSTTESKQTPMEVTVQLDGRASIPYVGTLQLAGKPLEAVRQEILAALRGKAVEPDVLVNVATSASRAITISGAVGSSSQIYLDLAGNRILEGIAKAGGPSRAPFDTKVTLIREGKRESARLSEIVNKPNENIYLSPGDQVFLEYDPSRFTVLGSTGSRGRIEFDSPAINLAEAIALAGDKNYDVADPQGFFVFRFEYEGALRSLIGDQAFQKRIQAGLKPDKDGRYPVVYRMKMGEASSYLTAQEFEVRPGDVLYLSRHPATDFTKFLGLLGISLGTVTAVQAL